MANVVIAHAPEDALPARALAQKLAYMGLQPTIELPPGEALRNAMRDASAAVVLWSPNSVGVADLILDIARTPRVIHARMQAAATPHEFSTERTIDLTGWRGEDDFDGWRELAAAVSAAAGIAAPAPSAAPRAPSGFFQPGAPPKQPAAPAPRAAAPAPPPRPAAPPPPRAPARDEVLAEIPRREGAPVAPPPRREEPSWREPEVKSGGPNLAVIGIVTFVLVAGLGGGGYWYMSQQGAANSLAQTWEDIDINDPAALRDFIERASGSLRSEAEQALRVLEDAEFDAAMEADTIEGFEGFVAKFPDSQYGVRARGRIAELRASQGLGAEAEDVAIDPETGLPIETDEDLLPPGSLETPEAPMEPDSATDNETAPAAPSGPAASPFTPPADNLAGPAPLTPPPAAPSQDDPLPTN